MEEEDEGLPTMAIVRERGLAIERSWMVFNGILLLFILDTGLVELAVAAADALQLGKT